MRVFITGGTGLIGRQIARRLAERGDHVVVLTRDAGKAPRGGSRSEITYVEGNPVVPGSWQESVDGCDAVINLAGQSLFAQRWSSEVKRLIRDSRVFGTGNVVAAIARAERRPAVLVQGSAIGYYGPHGDEEITEAAPPGDDFLAQVCRDWENAARPAADLDVRVPIVRTGVVLAKGEGALGVMAPVFRWVPGGAAPVGNGGSLFRPAFGRQWMSWVHIDDITGLFLLALDTPEATGPLNGTSPNPARNVDFGRALARALRRPPLLPWFFLPIGPPDFFLKAVLGEVADIIVKGQKVLPEQSAKLGYAFAYPELAGALAQIFARPKRPASVHETAAIS